MTFTTPRNIISRLVKVRDRYGTVGAARRIGREFLPAPRSASVVVWYVLDLGSAERPQVELGEGLVLRLGTTDDLGLLEQLPADPSVRTMSAGWVGEQLARGADLWLVHEGDRAAFRCWIFRDWFPMGGARGGGVDVPAEAIVLEDSLSSPAFRGRGVAPAAWSGLADHYRDQGLRRMYTKVNVDNGPSRRAVEKAGFRGVGRMQHVQRDWRTFIRVVLMDGDPAHQWLRAFARG